MVIFKNNLIKLLSEAGEDLETSNDSDVSEYTGEVKEESDTADSAFERLKRIRDHHIYLEKIIRDNDKSLDDEVEDDYLSTVNYILDELSNSKDQIRLLIVKGKILNLDSKKLATVYNKIQTKLINLIDLYEKVLNKNL